MTNTDPDLNSVGQLARQQVLGQSQAYLQAALNQKCQQAMVETPWFPFTIMLDEVEIVLHADGKWEGSIEGMRERLAAKTSWGHSGGVMQILMWLVLREMERDRRFW